jgi:GLPGLI family protein
MRNEIQRLLLSIIIICSNQLFVYSQTKYEAKVVYLYLQDKLGIREPYIFKFNKEGSVYLHHQEHKEFKSPQGYDVTLDRNFNNWYLDNKTKQVTEQIKQKDGTLLQATYTPEPIVWEIQTETKKIAGYTVQKAIAKDHYMRNRGDFDVEDAIAWFAIDLPINSGPEQFWGLPGLILELGYKVIADVYVAESISFERVGDIKPKGGVVVSKEELRNPNKIDKKWLKNARELLNNEN